MAFFAGYACFIEFDVRRFLLFTKETVASPADINAADLEALFLDPQQKYARHDILLVYLL